MFNNINKNNGAKIGPADLIILGVIALLSLGPIGNFIINNASLIKLASN